MINGRSMPDVVDPNYAVQYPHQPYNGNPHMHPGELVLLRVIGQGREQHPFHEHGNHVRVLARDGNLLLTATIEQACGPAALYDDDDAGPSDRRHLPLDRQGPELGRRTVIRRLYPRRYLRSRCERLLHQRTPRRPNYYEWCADHKKPLEKSPSARWAVAVPSPCPIRPFSPLAPWYGGSPYLGPDATGRAVGSDADLRRPARWQRPRIGEAGFAYMWHSHNEREITTNNIFPGGMMMMMLVDPRVYAINELELTQRRDEQCNPTISRQL